MDRIEYSSIEWKRVTEDKGQKAIEEDRLKYSNAVQEKDTEVQQSWLTKQGRAVAYNKEEIEILMKQCRVTDPRMAKI